MSNPYAQPNPYGQPAQPAYGQPPAPQGYPQAPQYAPPPPAQYAPPAPPAYGAPQGPGPYGQPPGYGYGAPAPAYPQAPYGQPPQAPQAPTVHGSMDAFGSQPSGGGGPGISFKDAPFGTTYTMTVKRDARDADVIQDRQPANQGGALKTRRDGSPQWVLTVPVFLPAQPVYQGGPAFPEGEATLYVRSGIREALVDAYGGQIDPKAGDQIMLTLTERKQVQGQGIPKNIFRAQVLRNGQPIAQGAQAQAPAPQAPPQWQGTPEGGNYPHLQPQAPQYQAPVQDAHVAPQVTYAQGPEAQVPVQPAQAPAQAQPGPIAGLPPMDPAQLALLQRLQGGGQQ